MIESIKQSYFPQLGNPNVMDDKQQNFDPTFENFTVKFVMKVLAEQTAPQKQLQDIKAKLTLEDGSTYSGKIKDGKPHGIGTWIWSDGSQYEGMWVNGIMEGPGKKITVTKDVYIGNFSKGLLEGEGIFLAFEKSDERSNYNEIDIYKKGIYRGRFKAGQFSGKGNFQWTNGDTYIGNFANNKMHGEGTQTKNTGDVLVGIFEDGIFKSGERTHNTMRKGEPHTYTNNYKPREESSICSCCNS
jgi:hypothetical protein